MTVIQWIRVDTQDWALVLSGWERLERGFVFIDYGKVSYSDLLVDSTAYQIVRVLLFGCKYFYRFDAVLVELEFQNLFVFIWKYRRCSTEKACRYQISSGVRYYCQGRNPVVLRNSFLILKRLEGEEIFDIEGLFAADFVSYDVGLELSSKKLASNEELKLDSV